MTASLLGLSPKCPGCGKSAWPAQAWMHEKCHAPVPRIDTPALQVWPVEPPIKACVTNSNAAVTKSNRGGKRSKAGRKPKHESAAAKQRAYRERKAA